MPFEYPEDRAFFCNLLAGGDSVRFEQLFGDFFDFRHPAIKRLEFDRTSKQALAGLIEKYGEVCQLQLHPDCSKEPIWETDHIIPLSSGELQRKLRNLKNNPDGSKPKSLSYGSNHPRNLILACKRCNAFKKQRIMLPKGVTLV